MLSMEKSRKITLLDFAFEKEPAFTPRTPYYWMSEDELRSIAKYYLLLDADCAFHFTVRIGKKEYTFNGVIPKAFVYNMADIPFVLQYISYDKHSPFVKNASCIHDYLISRKRILYEDWEMKAKGITPLEFKKITSEIFGYVLRYNAVPYNKAIAMATMVDLWQYFMPSWYSLATEEFEIK